MGANGVHPWDRQTGCSKGRCSFVLEEVGVLIPEPHDAVARRTGEAIAVRPVPAGEIRDVVASKPGRMHDGRDLIDGTVGDAIGHGTIMTHRRVAMRRIWAWLTRLGIHDGQAGSIGPHRTRFIAGNDLLLAIGTFGQERTPGAQGASRGSKAVLFAVARQRSPGVR